MPKNIITLALSCSIAAVSLMAINNYATANQGIRFTCNSSFDSQTGRKIPTTFIRDRAGKRPLIIWKFKWANNGVTRLERCQKVSARLQDAYNNGSLNFIASTSIKKRQVIDSNRIEKQRVICTAYRKGGPCNVVLLTLRPTDDAIEVLTTLKEAFRGRAVTPLQHSSGERRVDIAIDINKSIETIPVEGANPYTNSP